jgi:hypothetical protein
MYNDTQLHLECECHCHELHVERDDLLGDTPVWYFSFWAHGYTKQHWSWRWTQAFHTIWTGKPYGDEIIATREQLTELSEYIQDQLDKTK